MGGGGLGQVQTCLFCHTYCLPKKSWSVIYGKLLINWDKNSWTDSIVKIELKLFL